MLRWRILVDGSAMLFADVAPAPRSALPILALCVIVVVVIAASAVIIAVAWRRKNRRPRG
jgi:hypothetical protein